MGINYALLNKLDNAVNSFKIALKLDPNTVKARKLLAQALLQKGDKKEALKQLEIILSQNPNLNTIKIQLGLMYWKNEGFIDQARKLFKEALKASSNQKEKAQISYWLKELNKK